MISKEQFLELKHLKSLGVPTTTIAKKLGISVPSANKWLRLDEEAFNTHLINNTLGLHEQDPERTKQLRQPSRQRGCAAGDVQGSDQGDHR